MQVSLLNPLRGQDKDIKDIKDITFYLLGILPAGSTTGRLIVVQSVIL